MNYKIYSQVLIFANYFFRHFVVVNVRRLGFTKDFAGINFRELGFNNDLARINFLNLLDISREFNCTVASRKMFQRTFFVIFKMV